VSAIGATLFLGGYWGPWVRQVPWLGIFYLFGENGLPAVLDDLDEGGPCARFRYDR